MKAEHFLKPNIGSRAWSEKRNLMMPAHSEGGREGGERGSSQERERKRRDWVNLIWRETDRFIGVVKEDMAAET